MLRIHKHWDEFFQLVLFKIVDSTVQVAADEVGDAIVPGLP